MYKFRSEKEREYFRWLCRMYNEGILDPEFATQTHEDYIAKIASGRVVALFDKDWDYLDSITICREWIVMEAYTCILLIVFVILGSFNLFILKRLACMKQRQC